MEMRAGLGSILCWFPPFSSSTEGILDCGDFALAGCLRELSWLILGQVTSSKGAKTITNVCVFAVVCVCVCASVKRFKIVERTLQPQRKCLQIHSC